MLRSRAEAYLSPTTHRREIPVVRNERCDAVREAHLIMKITWYVSAGVTCLHGEAVLGQSERPSTTGETLHALSDQPVSSSLRNQPRS